MRREELEMLLRMIPIRILREIAYKKNVKVKTRQKEDFIKALAEKGDFSERDLDGLKDLVKTLEKEEEPVAQYILKIPEINLSELKSKLESTPARFDDSGALLSEGYEILEYRDGELLRARRWSKKVDYYLDRSGRPRSRTTINDSEITVDLNEGVIFIQGKYSMARKIKRDLIELGVELRPIGLLELERNESNQKFQEFINELESELRGL
ncbi:hypothetical protein DRP04_05835 [Archaeoglobales archaeon]|nr:MAG: hypothetical protein DRP04_05835 [Archaeoglobales archaeon]